MANPWTGEVELVVNGQRQMLKLTLGALAELEERLDEPSLVALVERFEQGRFSSRDVLELILAGASGAGGGIDRATLMRADIEGGPVAAARAAAQLIARAFIVPGASE